MMIRRCRSSLTVRHLHGGRSIAKQLKGCIFVLFVCLGLIACKVGSSELAEEAPALTPTTTAGLPSQAIGSVPSPTKSSPPSPTPRLPAASALSPTSTSRPAVRPTTSIQSGSERGAWQTYTTTHGLAGGFITAIGIDPSGHKWFGTSGGVSEFDGQSWHTYTTADGLVDNWINAMAIDPAGHKWFGTRGGVSEFNGLSWRTYTTTHGLVDNRVYAMAIDSAGHKWFGTKKGVSEFDGQSWRTYTTTHGLVDDQVKAMAIDPAGHKWFGTSGGISEFDGLSWRTYTTTHGLAFPYVTAVAIDPAGRKWFATHGGGLSLFDDHTWITYTAADGLASNIVYALAIDEAGQLWAGTSGGVSRFDGTTWTTYATRDGLLCNWVHAVAIDATGHKWFGCNPSTFFRAGWGVPIGLGGGVNEFDDGRWTPTPTTFPLVAETPAPSSPLFDLSIRSIDPHLIDDQAQRIYVRASINGIPQTLVLSLPEGRLLATYNLAGSLALDSVNGWLYIDQDDNRGLAVVNTRSGKLHSVIYLPEGRRRHFSPPLLPPQVDSVSGRVLAFRDNVVYIADPATGSIVDTLPSGITKEADNYRVLPVIEFATFEAGVLYLDVLTYAPGSYEAYETVSYDLASKAKINQAENFAVFPKGAIGGGYVLYQSAYNCRAALCTGRHHLWRAGRPWLESPEWRYPEHGPMAYDPTRRRFYEVTKTNLLVRDGETMALTMHLPRPISGDFIRYDAQTDQLQFWVEGTLQSWPATAIQHPSPEPLTPSPVPTTPVQFLAVSPAWHADQTLIGSWVSPARNTSDPLSDAPLSAYFCDHDLIYISQDGGQSWAQPAGGLTGSCGLSRPLAVSPDYARDQTVLANVPGLGIFRSTAGGQLWLPSSTGLSRMGVGQILLSPDFPDDQIAFAQADGQWYRSQNGGQSWQPLDLPAVNQASPENNRHHLALSPEFGQDQTLFAVHDNPAGDNALYLSPDGGEQWTLMDEMPPGAARLWVAPLFARWQTLFASGKLDNKGVLYRSTDGGRRWQVVLTGQAPARQVAFAPGIEQNRPVFTLLDKLYHSSDGGLTWQAFETPAEITPTSVAISPNFVQDRTLFIGTDKGEVLTLKVAQ